MKNRICSVLLCLLLVAATTLPALSPIFTPVEVGAIPGEGLTHEGHGTNNLAIYPASYMNANYWNGQRAWWDGTYYRPHADHSFDSKAEFLEKEDCLRIEGWDGTQHAEGFGRVRICLNDISGAVNADSFTHVRIIFRADSVPAHFGVTVFATSSSSKKVPPLDGNVCNGNIQATDMECGEIGGTIDCIWIDIIGTMYIYAVQLFNADIGDTNYNNYLDNVVRARHGIRSAAFDSNGGTPSYPPQYLGWAYDAYTAYATWPGNPTKTGYQFASWSGYTSSLPVSDFSGSTHKTTTFTAQWTPNHYYVAYDGNGADGGGTSTSTHYYDSTSYLSANGFTRTGYRFSHWKNNATGNTYSNGAAVYNWTTGYNVTAATLYAQWTPNHYTVSYNANGGSGTTNSTGHDYGTSSALASNNFSKTGYSFAGWYDAASGGNKITAASNLTSTHNGSVTLFAHWTPNTYTVTFNPTGGSVSPTSSTPTYDSTYGALPTPARTGYTFTGWYTAESDGSQVTSDTKMTTAAAHSLYAHWSINTYTISFNGNGGSTPDSFNYTIVDETTLPTANRNGYTLVGWKPSEDAESWKSDTTYPAGTTVNGKAGSPSMVAQWSANKYTVTFNPNGGDVGTASKDVTYALTYGELPTPTRNGYTFNGWFTEESGGTQITSDTTVSITAAQTLYAQWTINDYTLSFDGNGVDNPADVGYQVVSDGTLPTLERDGYTFDGWKPEESDGSWDANETYAGGTTLSGKYGTVDFTAQWTPIEYTVILLPNEGVLEDGVSDTIDYNVESEFTLPTPTRVGHTFDGWKVTVAAADGNWVADKLYTSEELTIAAGQYGDIRLTAQWTAISYDITYDEAEGQLPDNAEESYVYGTTPTLPTPIRAGFKFLGWKVTGLGQDTTGWTLNEIGTAVPSGAMGDVTLTAQWLWIGISVSYVMDNNVGTLTSYGDQMNDVEDMVVKTDGSVVKTLKEGYVFGGWYTDPTYTTPVDPDWVDEYGRIKVDLRDTDPTQWLTSYTFYAKGDYETQTITLSAQCTENPAQTFIYKITGTPVLAGVLGEISLEFTLLSGESLELKLPVGDYIITEYTDWSWRYPNTADGDETEDVERDVAIISRYSSTEVLLDYGTPTNTLWLNSYSVMSYPGKEPEITS